MAAGFTSRIGTADGDVCAACAHTDCRAGRALIARACVYCGKPLGEQVRFYSLDDNTVAHYLCVPAPEEA